VAQKETMRINSKAFVAAELGIGIGTMLPIVINTTPINIHFHFV